MANFNGLAMATIAIAMTACQSSDAEMIKTIAGQCGIDENSVINIAEEVLAARIVAETDMALSVEPLN